MKTVSSEKRRILKNIFKMSSATIDPIIKKGLELARDERSQIDGSSTYATLRSFIHEILAKEIDVRKSEGISFSTRNDMWNMKWKARTEFSMIDYWKKWEALRHVKSVDIHQWNVTFQNAKQPIKNHQIDLIKINDDNFNNLKYNKNQIELRENKFESFKNFFEIAKKFINQSKSENQLKMLNFSKVESERLFKIFIKQIQGKLGEIFGGRLISYHKIAPLKDRADKHSFR